MIIAIRQQPGESIFTKLAIKPDQLLPQLLQEINRQNPEIRISIAAASLGFFSRETESVILELIPERKLPRSSTR